MNKLIAFIIFLGSCCGLSAQQLPLYNHYFVNPFVYNPAYTGISENVNAFLVRNSRNSNFQGGAISNYLTVDAALGDENKYGIGIILNNQTHGIQQQFGGGLSYAYSLKINDDQRLRFGVQAGFLDSQLDQSEINVSDQDDPYLMDLNKNKLVFNGSAGIVYELYNTRIGFSVPQLLGNKVSYSGTSSRGYYQLERHFMGTVSHTFSLTKDLSLKPHVVIRFSPEFPLQFDGLVQLDYQKYGWLSVGYKSDYAMEFNVGIRFLGNFQVGYSYELIIGDLNGYQSGMNHEIMFGLALGNKDKKRLEELKQRNAQLDQEKSELAQDKLEAEAKLRQIMEEQRALKEKIVEDSLAILRMEQAANDSIIRLKKEIELAEQKSKANQNTSNGNIKTDKDKTNDNINFKDIIISKGYYFQELDNADSPDGFYVVTGVFSSRANADIQLEKCKNMGFADTKLVVNKKNNMYYVVALYTLEKLQAIESNQKYKKSGKGKVWILSYQKENN